MRFDGAEGRVFDATTAGDGRFSITVPAGTYTVTGMPLSHGASSPPGVQPTLRVIDPATYVPVCRAEAPVTVPVGGLGDVEVICQMR
ncbi:hypothetical protein ACFFX1_30095 [Dactylosporangium sucinum]|uniref:hypothetical protein n=1 Tax=Dactylosporangium sucinum TaxID=1424081 RepID=UPI00167C8B2E|nr:hypothetical protein [Dactylosporangium sucinum]